MPYFINQNNHLHVSKIYNYLKVLRTMDFKILYYLISFYIITILVLTFDIALVYRITHSIPIVAFSHFTYFLWIIFGYLLFYIFKIKIRVSTLYRYSLIFLSFLFLYAMLAYSKLTSLSMLFPIFSIRGAAVSLFALAFDVSFINGFKDKQRDRFSLLFYSIYILLPIFLPFLGGYLINNFSSSFFPTNAFLPNGYFLLFLFGFLLSILFITFSPTVNIYINASDGIKNPIKLLFKKEIAPIRNYQIYDAFSLATKGTILGILGFMLLTNELNLGFFSSVIALFASLYFLIIRNKEKKYYAHRLRVYIYGILGEILSSIFLFLNTNILGLIIRSIVITLVGPLKRTAGENMLRKNYDYYSEKLKLEKSNFILVQEISYFVGRLLSFLIIIMAVFFGNYNSQNILRGFLILFIILDIFEYFFVRKIDLNK